MKFQFETAQNELSRIEKHIKQSRIARKRLIRHADLLAELQPDSVYSTFYGLYSNIHVNVPGFTTIACPWLADAIECLTDRLGVEPTSRSDATDGIIMYSWRRDDKVEITLYATLDDNALCLRIPVGEPEIVEEMQYVKVPKQRFIFAC